LRLADRALADAESAAHAPTMGYVLTFGGLLGLVRCNPEAVAAYSQALTDIVSRYDLPAFVGFAVFLQGWANWPHSAEDSKLAEMRRGLAIEGKQARFWVLRSIEATLVEAKAGAGEIDAGLRRLDDALAELERTEQRWYAAEMHRIRGEILLKRDPADAAGAAERSLQTAIAVAQSQKARSFELRAALSLAGLYRSTNRYADAHAALAPAVEGFPPTKQFPELAEAQTLLSALTLSSIRSGELTKHSAASLMGQPSDPTPVTASLSPPSFARHFP
jgi:predicted ATPase